MPACPVCSTPVTRTEILCQRCFYEDDEPARLPTCQRCRWNESCHESWYEICYACMDYDRQMLEQAAIPIQSFLRGLLARKNLKKHRAARRLQAVWRGYVSRSQPKLL